MSINKPDRRTLSKVTITSLPSKNSVEDDDENNDENQIFANISVPEDGGWGWVVVFFVFIIVLILDGVVFTFGTIMLDIVTEMKQTQPVIALANSIAMALYFVAGPIAASIINNHGFRVCSMAGSVISCVALCLASYFATSAYLLILFYGVIAGFGYSMICMSSSLVVGFYFEKYRALAYTLSSMGSGAGVIAFSKGNSYLINIVGWRTVTLLHSVLMGSIYFFSMSFRPLKSVQVIATVADIKNSISSSVSESRKSQRFLSGGSSKMQFPTVADVIEESIGAPGYTSPGPSSIIGISALSLVRRPQGAQNTVITLGSIKSTFVMNRSVASIHEEERKKTCCGRLCHWDHTRNARPMYRDDAFYVGKVANLPQYDRFAGTDPAEKSGLEYQLAVSRAATKTDFKDKRTMCSTAVRRVLATMLDPSLLRRPSFLVMCIACLSIYMGFLVPYVYIQERAEIMGLPENHVSLFMCVVGLANALGRPVLGILANSILDPLHMTTFLVLVAGLTTVMSGISYNLTYQYFYCVVFGFSIASIQCLKSLIIASLYGLDKLTNAIGIIFVFQGVGCLFSAPMAAELIVYLGVTWAFYVSGGLVLFGGLLLFLVKFIVKGEKVELTM